MRAGLTRVIIGGADTSATFGSFELDANVVDNKHERALEAILEDASGIDQDVVKGSALRSQ